MNTRKGIWTESIGIQNFLVVMHEILFLETLQENLIQYIYLIVRAQSQVKLLFKDKHFLLKVIINREKFVLDRDKDHNGLIKDKIDTKGKLLR